MADIYEVTLPGALLQRGFWLYVWQVDTPKGQYLYVGRTGDSSSPNAAEPYRRFGQHLGSNKHQNALKRHLLAVGVDPLDCEGFHFFAYGPIFEEEGPDGDHQTPRDIVAALEKKLADSLRDAGYNVMNNVRSLKPLDQQRWLEVTSAFAQHFQKLRSK